MNQMNTKMNVHLRFLLKNLESDILIISQAKLSFELVLYEVGVFLDVLLDLNGKKEVLNIELIFDEIPIETWILRDEDTKEITVGTKYRGMMQYHFGMRAFPYNDAGQFLLSTVSSLFSSNN